MTKLTVGLLNRTAKGKRVNAEPSNHDDSILDLLRKSPAEQAPSDESTPEQIWDGKYRLKECLGGQMNNVFRAERIDMSDMPVVVKILATSSARHRMIEQEKEVLGKLSTLGNPHIVAPIDAGEYQGARYIVTSFVDGVHLGEYVADRKRPLSVSEVCSIGRQAAEGLAAAHEMAIVHGDIKPNNLVIKDRQVKIIDWGVSLDLNSMGEEEGILGGTVDFMPPEQLNGDSVDGRADVYSLGVTLVTLLLGGKLPDPASWWLNCKQELPDGLRELLSRMMSANPNGRPTMSEAESLLATFPSDQKSYIPPDAKSRAAAPRRVALVALALVVAGFIGWKLFPHRDSVAMADTVQRLVLAVGDAGAVSIDSGNHVTKIAKPTDIPDGFAGRVFLDVTPESKSTSNEIAKAISGKNLVFGGVTLRGPHVSVDLLNSLKGQTIANLWIEKTKSISEGDIARIGEIRGLRELVIRDVALGQNVGAAFTVERFSSLRRLQLNSDLIVDSDVIQLARLPALRVLEIDNSQISRDGLEGLLAAKRLVGLGLGGTSITDEEMPSIGKLTGLRNLRLNETDITDKGIGSLTSLKLDHLELGGNSQISDKSVSHLTKLQQLSYLGVGNTAISSPGMEALRRGLPNCEIVVR